MCAAMSLRLRTHPRGHIKPCLPSPAERPPPGPDWLHEIKHDGFRILARKDAAGVRLITCAGNDFSSRFPFIAMAVSKLPVRLSCLIDGEAVVCDENGLAVIELIRRHGAFANAVLCAFDLLELDGRDLRREPIEKRKALLAELLKGSHSSIVPNAYRQELGSLYPRFLLWPIGERMLGRRSRQWPRSHLSEQLPGSHRLDTFSCNSY
jgi:ATP-dependent DNA ligase